MTEVSFYIAIAIVVTAVNLTLSIRTFKNPQKNTNFFGGVLLAAAFQEVFYTLSLLTTDYFTASMLLGAFFASVTVMLFLLMVHIDLATDANISRRMPMYFIFGGISCADIMLQMANSFNHLVISYSYEPANSMPWSYHPHTLYTAHLIFCYILMAHVFLRIFHKIIATPSVYKMRHYTIASGLLIAVLFNLVCIVFQNLGLLDYSQISYCIMAAILYWDLFYNNQKFMLNSVRQMVFDDLEQPIILFGDNNIAAMCNSHAALLMPDWNPRSKYHISEFLKRYDFDSHLEEADTNTHFQWTRETSEGLSTYRVDFNVLKDKKGKVIGRLFVFTDTSLEQDLLTGFTSKAAFERHVIEDPVPPLPAAVAVFDINGLSIINKKYGNEAGNQCIIKLAEAIVSNCPDNTFFARLDSAELMAVVPNTSSYQMKQYIKAIKVEAAVKSSDIPFDIQSAFIIINDESSDILQAVADASFSMRSRKMMDGSSAHSSLLDSLAQTLLESDDTTKEHVYRTRKYGALLGEQLGLSDLDLSNLLLLCLLHDIGKLGIPIEILNKPGRLTSAEWEVMKSHVEKGYRIAKASSELEGIAEYILHHHESWDGKGYPGGLKKENIPLLSRIIAVIDAYDAMVNDRPYHKAMAEIDARNELRRCAGTQFDPYLVSEFLHLLDETKPIEDTPSKQQAPAETGSPVLPEGATPLVKKDTGSTRVWDVRNSSYLLDDNNRIIAIDDNFTEITGYTRDDLETYQLTQRDLIPLEDREEYIAKASESLSDQGSAFLEHRLRRKDGSILYVLCHGQLNYDVISRQTLSQVVIVDVNQSQTITQMKAIEQQRIKTNLDRLESSIRQDPMTGILNHASFINDFETQLMQGQTMLLLLMDVDYFKQYNDNYGHIAGDTLLKKLASAMEMSCGAHGFAGRLGGDEFAIAIPIEASVDASAIAQNMSEDVFRNISRELSKTRPLATVSVGATLSSYDNRRFQSLYQVADEALYASKKAGRNLITFK
ncbi:MAG: diguanylate cyclase [Eubacterium sp.]|nr:diguanylate cyclase [Candidatus Colimonas fimequi]